MLQNYPAEKLCKKFEEKALIYTTVAQSGAFL
jgi:hypothetical protein